MFRKTWVMLGKPTCPRFEVLHTILSQRQAVQCIGISSQIGSTSLVGYVRLAVDVHQICFSSADRFRMNIGRIGLHT